MAYLQKGKVVEIIARNKDCTEILVKISSKKEKAINYPQLTGKIEIGDEVILNTIAVRKKLGTGDYYFVLWNLKYKDLVIPARGHIIKLRYTPIQFNILAAEEEESPYYAKIKNFKSLENMPVIIGSLHSQLAPAAVVIKKEKPKTKISYIMTDGGALPISFSHLVRQLKKKKIIDSTITIGHAFGGDFEAINIFSGLAIAKVAARSDIAIVIMGPGHVGTNSPLAFSGIEQGEIINAVNSLQGIPIAIPRISFADKRIRHRVISHHTLTALSLATCTPCIVTLPQLKDEKMELVKKRLSDFKIDKTHQVKIIKENTPQVLDEFGIEVTTMDRGIKEDEEFFRAAGAAGKYATQYLK